MKKSKKPVILITGYLGSGKTILLICNFIVLNKCDLLNEDQLKEVESIARDFQPRAPIIHSVNGDIDIDKIKTKSKPTLPKIPKSGKTGIPAMATAKTRSSL